MPDPFPLQWPEDWPRTLPAQRRRSKYKVTFAQARAGLLEELRLLGARSVVISSDIPVRIDGLPYADWREPSDPGIAVYWLEKDGRRSVMPCDNWRTTRENLHAIGLTIQALRSIDRAGAGELRRRAFAGFAALPANTYRPPERHWREVLGLPDGTPPASAIQAAFRKLATERHPDLGGTLDEWLELQRARDRALVDANGATR